MIDNIIKCYDNGGKTIDRYTVAFPFDHFYRDTVKFYQCVFMNSEPFHPQGVGSHGDCQLGPHLGKPIKFKDLPNDCQKLVIQDLRVYFPELFKTEVPL